MELNKLNNLLELFNFQYNRQNPNNIFLKSLKNPKNIFTWQQTYDCIQKLSNKLNSIIRENDRCLLISENRPEWLISDLAIMLANGVTVPAYTTYTERDYEYLINDSKPSVVIVSNQIQYDKVHTIVKSKNFIKLVISLEELKSDNNKIINIKRIFEKENTKKYKLEDLKLKRTDLACIIYTSGTQGEPKGVMLSHGGILNNCEGSYKLLKGILSSKPKFLTWLPLSHSYEHTVQFIQIAVGAKVFYAESIDKLLKNISDCSPDIMTAVPRFYQNLYQKINSTFSKATGIKKYLVDNTVKLGSKKFRKEKMTIKDKLINNICEILVRSKVKKQFGGNLKTFVSGGGALDPKVGTFLNSIGLPTLQGYGLTEASPVVSCNPVEDIRIDTVGIPFRCNSVKIAEDGEILVKGENVMLGYWNNKEETDKVLVDGWLYTGDIGKFVNGYLKITDRKKDILISPGGDNISPVKVETALSNSNFIDQSLVYGDNKPYLVALIVLNSEINFSEADLNEEIKQINKNLSNIERVKKYFIVNEKFSIENGMVTPTLKLKRYKIIELYKNNFENLYKIN